MAGYIFDYGGTLDTGGRHWGIVIWNAYQRCGVPVDELRFREAYVYAERWLGRHKVIRPHYTFREMLAKKLLLQLDYLGSQESPLLHFFPDLLDLLWHEARLHTQHSRRVLAELRKRGCGLALVSNFYGNLSTVLHEFGFDGLFDGVVESAVVGIRKPDPRIFQLGAEMLGLPCQECIVVGDSADKDMFPALAAGCRVIWLQGEPWEHRHVDTLRFERVITRLEQLL